MSDREYHNHMASVFLTLAAFQGLSGDWSGGLGLLLASGYAFTLAEGGQG